MRNYFTLIMFILIGSQQNAYAISCVAAPDFQESIQQIIEIPYISRVKVDDYNHPNSRLKIIQMIKGNKRELIKESQAHITSVKKSILDNDSDFIYTSSGGNSGYTGYIEYAVIKPTNKGLSIDYIKPIYFKNNNTSRLFSHCGTLYDTKVWQLYWTTTLILSNNIVRILGALLIATLALIFIRVRRKRIKTL